MLLFLTPLFQMMNACNRVSAEIPPLAGITRWFKSIAQKMPPFSCLF